MKKLNLGCGQDIRKGWVNLDIVKHEGVDVVHDLNQLPLPFSDESFDFIGCYDILEHVEWIPLMGEIHRILRKGGKVEIRVPHFTAGDINYGDPSHKHLFSTRSFEYFIEKNVFEYEYRVSYFSRIFKRITFRTNGLLKGINFILEKWINKSARRQNFYEYSFLHFFPAKNIEVTLVK